MSQRCHGSVRESYGNRGTLWHQWGNHRMHADAIRTGGIRYRAGIIQSAPKLRAQLDGVFSNYLRRAKRHTQYCFAHAIAAVRPNAAITGHRQIGNLRVRCHVIQQTEEYGSERCASLIGSRADGSHSITGPCEKLPKPGEWPVLRDRQASSWLCDCLWSPI